jgi:dienelactone hydrolase
MNTIETNNFRLAVNMAGDEKADKLALILPGRLDTKDYVHMTDLVEKMANEGYLAVSFDPPGTWESSGSIDLYTTENYLLAIKDLINHFGSRPTVTIGHSRGGSMALLAAAKYPEVIACVAIMSNYGPSSAKPESIEKGYEESLRDLPPGTSRTTEKQRFELPISYFEDGDIFVQQELARCVKPKLFFWGNQDKILSEQTIKSGFNIAAEPKRLVELKSEHDYRLHTEVIEDVWRHIRAFLKENRLNNSQDS